MKKSLSLILFLLFFSSCGKNSKNKNDPPKEETTNNESTTHEEDDSGIYLSILRPLNTKLSGYLPSGKSLIKISENKFLVHTFVDDASLGSHPQGILTGTRCPDESDDTNLDGYIDEMEFEKKTGKFYMWLHGELANQQETQAQFPSGKKYTYRQVAELEDLRESLNLEENQPLKINNRIIAVFGTRNFDKFPPSANFKLPDQKHLRIAVACGQIIKMKKINENEWKY
jgi:hypothetical protein